MFDLVPSEMKALERIYGHIYQETLFFKSQPQMQRRPQGEAKHGEVAEYSLNPGQLFLAERIIGQIMHALARIVPQSMAYVLSMISVCGTPACRIRGTL
jgi:hypothetical protein